MRDTVMHFSAYWCTLFHHWRIRVRQVIIIVIAALLIGYDLFMLNGYYVRLVIAEVTSLWNAVERWVLSLL